MAFPQIERYILSYFLNILRLIYWGNCCKLYLSVSQGVHCRRPLLYLASFSVHRFNSASDRQIYGLQCAVGSASLSQSETEMWSTGWVSLLLRRGDNVSSEKDSVRLTRDLFFHVLPYRRIPFHVPDKVSYLDSLHKILGYSQAFQFHRVHSQFWLRPGPQFKLQLAG